MKVLFVLLCIVIICAAQNADRYFCVDSCDYYKSSNCMRACIDPIINSDLTAELLTVVQFFDDYNRHNKELRIAMIKAILSNDSQPIIDYKAMTGTNENGSTNTTTAAIIDSPSWSYAIGIPFAVTAIMVFI